MNTSIPAGDSDNDRLRRFMAKPPGASDPYGSSISFTDIRGMIWRQRRILVVVVAATVLLGLVITLLLPQRFEAVATVRIDNESLKILEGQDLDPVVGLNDTARYLNTQKQVLESRTIALKVAESLGLAKDNAFLETMRADPVDEDLPPAELAAKRLDAVAEVLQANVRMDIPDFSRIASITFQSADAELAARVANSYVEAFLTDNVNKGYEANAYARRILGQQVEQAQAELRSTELDAIAYARSNRLIDAGESPISGDSSASGTSGGSITTSNLVQVNQAFIEARNARILAEQRWRTAQAANPRDLAEARDNPAFQSLIADRAQKSAEIADLRERYLADHPRVVQAQAALSDIDTKMTEAATSLRNSIRNEYEVARRQELELAKVREQLSDATLQEQDRRVQLGLISRDAQLQRDQLEELQRRLNQLDSASDIGANNMTMLDVATVPETPVSPKLMTNLMIALVIGVAIAGGLALLRETLDDTIHSPDDAERKLGLPLLGVTPKVGDEESEEGAGDAGDLSEAYFSIRAALDYASAGDAHKVFLIASGQSNEGKSTTAMALARDFARIGRKVLLVDGDLRRPSLHKLARQSGKRGLIDVLAQKASIEEVVLRAGPENLDLLPLGPIPPNPAQLLSSDLLPQFIAKARALYDIVLLDSAPVMGLADTPLLSQHADFTVLIVEAGRAHFGQAKSAVRRMRDSGANILGIVITKFDHRDAGYGYDYLYAYNRDDEAEEERPKRSFVARALGSN